MKKYSFFLALILSLLFISGYCYADSSNFEPIGLQPLPPNGVFSTFSANTIAHKKTAFSVSLERLGEPDFYRFSGYLAYGIVNSIELNLSIPYITEWGDNIDGFEDISFGLRHRLLIEEKHSIGAAYLITASMISGKDELSTDGHIGAGIAVSKRVGPVSGHANLIYALPGNSDLNEELTFSAGFDFSAGHDFKLLGELYGKRSYYSDNSVDNLELRFGSRLTTRENFFTTVGAGFGFKDSPEYRIMLSVTVLFPQEKKVIKKVIEEAE